MTMIDDQAIRTEYFMRNRTEILPLDTIHDPCNECYERDISILIHRYDYSQHTSYIPLSPSNSLTAIELACHVVTYNLCNNGFDIILFTRNHIRVYVHIIFQFTIFYYDNEGFGSEGFRTVFLKKETMLQRTFIPRFLFGWLEEKTMLQTNRIANKIGVTHM